MKTITTQINKTLESIDNIGQAETTPFFETRLKAKMEKQLLTNSYGLIVKKPVWAIASLAAFLCINLYVLSIKKMDTAVAKNSTGQPATIENFAADYQLSTSTSPY